MTLPDVWEAPATGLPWCDCGDDHSLTEDFVTNLAGELFDGIPERLTHEQVVAITCDVWLVENPCRFRFMQVEDAAEDVNGTVAEDYTFRVGFAVVKRFSDKWNGCPQDACA